MHRPGSRQESDKEIRCGVGVNLVLPLVVRGACLLVGTPSPGPRTTVTTSSVHPIVRHGAAYAWRLLVMAAAVVALVWLAGRLLIVLVPIAVALLITRALSPVRNWLTRHHLRPGLAAIATLLAFILFIVAVVGVAATTMVNELDDLGAALNVAIDDIEVWLVEDGPFDVARDDVQRWRDQAGDALAQFVSSDRATLAAGAVVAGEFLVGILLALVVTFFFLKDGHRFSAAAARHAGSHGADVTAAAGRAWDALGGYLRGAAALGALEATVIGVTLLLVGAELVVPVAIITLVFAFVPIVGAIAAGVIAILVTLATAGFPAALIVAAVVIVVQQLDNDLLAPVIYGKALQLHPLVILLGIAAGGAMFGIIGTIFAVPALAVAFNVVDELRLRHADTTQPTQDLHDTPTGPGPATTAPRPEVTPS